MLYKKSNNQYYNWALQAGIWLGLTVLGFFSFSMFFAPLDAVKHAVFNSVLLAILFYTHTYLVNRYLEKRNIPMFLLMGGAVFALITVIRMSVNIQLMFTSQNADGEKVFQDPRLRIIALVMISSFIVALVAVFYQLLQNRFSNERKNLALINEQQAAQLQFLKAQINPHFLFNALNNVYSLTVVKSDDAPKMLLKLSDLLRYVIYDSQKSEVELTREIKHIQEFIALFQMRSETPLSIKFENSGNLMGKTIEPMILIPIVENCFKHCDFDQNSSAFAQIDLHVLPDGTIHFATKNTFDQNDTQKDAVGGVGLENIRRRLMLRYPDRFDLIFGAENNLFTVNLIIKTNE